MNQNSPPPFFFFERKKSPGCFKASLIFQIRGLRNYCNLLPFIIGIWKPKRSFKSLEPITFPQMWPPEKRLSRVVKTQPRKLVGDPYRITIVEGRHCPRLFFCNSATGFDSLKMKWKRAKGKPPWSAPSQARESKVLQVRALGRHGEAFISSLDWGWGWDAGLGRDPSAARPDSFPSKASGKRNKTPRSPTPSRSEPAAYSFGSGGTGRDQATPQTSACGAWPPRPGPPGARAGEPSKKGAARAAGEDGARRATAPDRKSVV